MGRTLSPPPANLAFLAQMPMVQWDPLMYWTIAEGGAQFGSAIQEHIVERRHLGRHRLTYRLGYHRRLPGNKELARLAALSAPASSVRLC